MHTVYITPPTREHYETLDFLYRGLRTRFVHTVYQEKWIEFANGTEQSNSGLDYQRSVVCVQNTRVRCVHSLIKIFISIFFTVSSREYRRWIGDVSPMKTSPGTTSFGVFSTRNIFEKRLDYTKLKVIQMWSCLDSFSLKELHRCVNSILANVQRQIRTLWIK